MPEQDRQQQTHESMWKRLTRLFRSGPVVRHKIANGEKAQSPQGTAKAFKKELSSLYVRALASYANYERLSRYSDYNEMEYCLSGDTQIAIPGGYVTIKELAETKGLDETFIVYSFDHSKGKIVPALGRQARKTRSDHSWRVRFDNGRELIGTEDHRLMLRDGSYRTIGELKAGDAMMPFKRRSLFSPSGLQDPDHYQFIYLGDGDSPWVGEHRVIGAWMAGRPLLNEEEVHHINFRKSDNSPGNLRVMDRTEHRRYHVELVNARKWDPVNNAEWIAEFKRRQSEFMTASNPAERKDITFERVLALADEVGFNCRTICRLLDTDPNVVKRRVRSKGFRDWEQFAASYCPEWRNSGWNNAGNKNPRFDHGITFQMICKSFEKGMTHVELAKKLGTSKFKLNKRVQENGFADGRDFCATYENCRVVSVEYHGVIDLYDLTVDGYKNFATDFLISHNTPELHGALDIYSDEATVRNDDGNVIEVSSRNQEIKEVLETLFFDVINLNFNAWSWMRHFCKFGDFVLFVDADEEHGILNLYPIPINEIEREEGYDPNDPMAVRFRWLTRGNTILENWQVIHFRLLGNDAYLPYGSSVLEPARRIWRQLILIEDAMLVYRIVRSPERRVFHIEVGNTPPEHIDTFMEQVKTQLKRNTIVDPETGRVDLRYNPLSVEEDYILPKRGEQKSEISTLAGGQFTGDIEDVQYIQSKMFAAIKIPRAYLGYEDQLGSKATLAQEDVRFSKTIERIQSLFVAELNKIAIVHLFLCGYSGEDLVNFEISMANPSTIAAQQRLELWRMKLEVAGMAQEGVFDRNFIYRKIFGLNDKQIAAIKDGKRTDKLEDALLMSIEAPPSDAMPPPDGGAEAPAPGAEELPDTLGGPPADAGGAPEAAPAGITQIAGRSLAGPVLREKRNPGSTGVTSGIGVNRGKDLFSTGEDQFRLSFGTEKQTASDPTDRRAARRLITRPFSEESEFEMPGMEQVDEVEEMLRRVAARL